MTARKEIDDFLGRKRLAMVGVSRNEQHFSRTLFRELRIRGHDVVPVNPTAGEVDGLKCFARVQDIAPAAEAALLMTNPSATDRVVRDCAEAGIRSVWMYRAAGAGAVSPEAVVFCEANGIRVVAGECPFMFLPETAWVHRLHGFCRKLVGSYPR